MSNNDYHRARIIGNFLREAREKDPAVQIEMLKEALDLPGITPRQEQVIKSRILALIRQRKANEEVENLENLWLIPSPGENL